MSADKKHALYDYTAQRATFSPKKEEYIASIDSLIERLTSMEQALNPFMSNLDSGKEVKKIDLVHILKTQNMAELAKDVKNLQAQIGRAQIEDAAPEAAGLTNAEKAGLMGIAIGVGYIITGISGIIAGAATAPATFGVGTAVGIAGGLAACKQGLDFIIAGRNKYAGVAPEDLSQLNKAEWRVNDIENKLNSLQSGLEIISKSVNDAINSAATFFFHQPAVNSQAAQFVRPITALAV